MTILDALYNIKLIITCRRGSHGNLIICNYLEPFKVALLDLGQGRNCKVQNSTGQEEYKWIVFFSNKLLVFANNLGIKEE